MQGSATRIAPLTPQTRARKSQRKLYALPPPPPQQPMMPAPPQPATAGRGADDARLADPSAAADATADAFARLRFGSDQAHEQEQGKSDHDADLPDPSLALLPAPSSPSSCERAPRFHDPTESPLSPDERTAATQAQSSPRTSRNNSHSGKHNQREDERSAASASSCTDAAASSSSSHPTCSCFSVQYTCALCKTSVAVVVARSSSAPVPARNIKAVATAHGSVVPSAASSTRTSQPTSHSPTAMTREPSPACSAGSPVAAAASSSAPSASPDDEMAVPTLNLAALEEEVERKYHIDRLAEQRALQRNKEAVKAQQELEDRARQAAQAQGQRPASPHQYHHTHKLNARGKPIFTWDEIRTHNSAESCWLVVRGTVYDVTPMLATHPAGIQSILRNGGTEATSHFDFHSKAASKLWSKYEIGVLEGHTTPSCTIQ